MSKHSARESIMIKVPVWVAIVIALTISAMVGFVLPIIALVFGGHHYR